MRAKGIHRLRDSQHLRLATLAKNIPTPPRPDREQLPVALAERVHPAAHPPRPRRALPRGGEARNVGREARHARARLLSLLPAPRAPRSSAAAEPRGQHHHHKLLHLEVVILLLEEPPCHDLVRHHGLIPRPAQRGREVRLPPWLGRLLFGEVLEHHLDGLGWLYPPARRPHYGPVEEGGGVRRG